jgi:hypothetical protein
MRVRISEPELLVDLVEFLHGRIDLVVDQRSPDEIDAWLLGSYSLDAHDLALELQVRAWQAAHPGVEVEVIPQDRREDA